MTAQAVEEIVRRARDDAAFRRLFKQSPDEALHGYDLTVPERQALIAGDEAKLQQLNVDVEASRMAAELNRDETTPS
jgi:hypothetical protein